MSRTLFRAVVRARHLALMALGALVAVAAAGPDPGGLASGPASSEPTSRWSASSDHDDDDEESDAGPDAGEGVPDAGADGGPVAEPPSDQEAVGALVDDGQRAFCTGALLSPDIILTAAHCVAQDGVVRWPWGFFLGDDITLGGQFVRVLDGAVHPSYDPFLHTADLAVLRIAGGPPRTATLPIDADVPEVGVPVRIFGFGSGAAGPTRRDAEVTSQTEDSFRYEPGTCPGDSGGPVLVGDDIALVAGVVFNRRGRLRQRPRGRRRAPRRMDWRGDGVPRSGGLPGGRRRVRRGLPARRSRLRMHRRRRRLSHVRRLRPGLLRVVRHRRAVRHGLPGARP